MYRLDIYELLNRTSSRIVRVAAASGLAQEFRIILPTKSKLRIVRARSIRVYTVYFLHFYAVVMQPLMKVSRLQKGHFEGPQEAGLQAKP